MVDTHETILWLVFPVSYFEVVGFVDFTKCQVVQGLRL